MQSIIIPKKQTSMNLHSRVFSLISTEEEERERRYKSFKRKEKISYLTSIFAPQSVFFYTNPTVITTPTTPSLQMLMMLITLSLLLVCTLHLFIPKWSHQTKKDIRVWSDAKLILRRSSSFSKVHLLVKDGESEDGIKNSDEFRTFMVDYLHTIQMLIK